MLEKERIDLSKMAILDKLQHTKLGIVTYQPAITDTYETYYKYGVPVRDKKNKLHFVATEDLSQI